MAITITKKKRTRGKRAGLSRATIAEAALQIVDQGRDLSIAKLAKAQKQVAPAAIYGHFPGKLSEIHAEMVRVALKGLGRPFMPSESWEEYVQALFRSAASTFKNRRNLAGLVALELSSNYYLNPLLIERILYALHMAGLSEEARAKTLNLVMGALIGFLSIDRPGLKSLSTQKWIEAQAKLLNELPGDEFPETTGLKQWLLKSAVSRSAQVHAKQPSVERADRFAHCLIREVKILKSA